MHILPRLITIAVLGFYLLVPSLGYGANDGADDDKLPSIEEVAATMKKAGARFRHDASLFGGYPRGWTADRTTAIAEDRRSATIIEIQPPGTPVIGLAWIEAWRVTGDPLYLQAAREVAQALTWCQLASGGWSSDFDFHPESAAKYHLRRDLFAGDIHADGRRNRSTLDDNKTQSALHFLLELAHLEPSKDDASVHDTLAYGMNALLAAQAPNGGWPQMYSKAADTSLPTDLKASYDANWPRQFPSKDYTGYYTLNDGNIYHVVRLLARAQELSGDKRYIDSIRKTGEFLIAAQLPAPHPAWAQQYDLDMKPAWARKFEPPAVSSIESKMTLDTLLEIWVITGDDQWLTPIQNGIDWLRSVQLEDGRWARFYELGTNRPLYLTAESYEVTYDDSNLPTHYAFKIDGKLGLRLDRLEQQIAEGREALLRRRQPMIHAADWAKQATRLQRDVQSALKAVDSQGRWLNEKGELDSRLFQKHFSTLIRYLEAATEAGTYTID